MSRIQPAKTENNFLIIKNREQEEKIKQLEKINAQLVKENIELKDKIIQVRKESNHFQQESEELKKENLKLKEKEQILNENIDKLQIRQSPEKQQVERSGFRILDEEEIKNLEILEEIGSKISKNNRTAK